MAIKTPAFYEAANKAAARIAESGTDIERLTREVRMGSPDQIASEHQKQQRRRMLENLYSEEREAQQAFERIIGGNELQDANYLPRGALVARAVVRVEIINGRGRRLGFGSGFFVGDGVLMTNNHVLKNEELARASEIQMFYERDLLGQDRTPLRFRLNPQKLFYTNERLDFTIVAVEEESIGGPEGTKTTLAEVGWLPLIAELGKVMEGEWLTIIQHPNGERKQVCARDNQFLARSDDVLWYSTDTLGGSSGSPVFTNDWLVVALHHSGVPRIEDGAWKTVDGQDYNPSIHDDVDIDWIANEGIRISKIIERLRTDLEIATHPMIAPMLNVGVRDITSRLPVMFRGGKLPESLVQIARTVKVADYMKPADGEAIDTRSGKALPVAVPALAATVSGDQTINLTLSIKDGVVSVDSADMQGLGDLEFKGQNGRAYEKSAKLRAPVDPERDWVGADGFDPRFLGRGAKTVNLPELIPEFAAKVAPLRDAYGETFSDAQKEAGVLNYVNYSVVMNAQRKFAFYSAANVDWGMRPYLSGRDDRWMYDDRIARDAQVDNSYYKHNKFDRGHLTRREDLEFGADPIAATISANNTCTWTNCVPQHSRFNQNKQLWQGLERYILENSSLESQFKLQAFTGPVFGLADPEYRGLAYPLEFWKVLAAINPDGDLFATAYLLSQEEVVDDHGLEGAERDRLGAYRTFQVPVAEVEGLTGLRFTSGVGRGKKPLSDADPLARTREPHRVCAPRRGSGQESFSRQSQDGEILDFSDIILG
ncbi:DNA/RNA non-specific endonuclease [Erythrobacter longus]|nr:DNA/RNA non-specific endonuclease [Erythrobacter longus]